MTGIDVVSLRIDINKNGSCPAAYNCFSSGDKAVGRRDDFIVSTDSQRLEREREGIRTVGHADRMLHSAELCEGPFKLLDLRASYKGGAVQQGIPDFSDLVAKRVMLTFEIHERHHHLCLMTWSFGNLLRHYLLPSSSVA